MKIAVEIIILAILVACAWNGYKKGLIMGIGTIIAIIISLYVGDLLSDTFSKEVVPVVHPFVSGYMEGADGVIGKSMTEILGSEAADLSLEDTLEKNPDLKFELSESSFKKMGIYSADAKKMAVDTVSEAERTKLSLPEAIVKIMTERIVYWVGFFLFFILVLIILVVIGNITNLSFKIPGKNGLNNYGGLIMGIITGILFCFVFALLLRFTGMIYPEKEYSHSILASFFIKFNVLTGFLSA